MKRRIALLLVICLLTSMVPAATAGGAAGDGILDNEIEIVDVGEQDITGPLEPDGIELEADALPDELGDILPEGDMPELELGESLELPEGEALLPESEAQGDASEANDDSSDFTVVNGVLTKYNGAGGDVVIPDGVKSIGSDSFSDIKNMTSLTIPGSVTRIERYAFYQCSGGYYNTVVNIQEGLVSIGECAFLRCSFDITIPKSVTTIEEGAFSYCKVSVSPGNTHFKMQDGFLCTADGKTLLFWQWTGKDIAIPEGITRIGKSAFHWRSTLNSVNIPGSVQSIGEHAFLYCSGLKNVVIPDGVKKIEDEAFYGCSNLESVSIPASAVEIGKDVFKNCDLVKIKGYTGSCAETYAKDNGLAFESIGAIPATPKPTATPAPTAPPQISIPKALTLGVKETYALDAAGASFKSSNKSVAAVDKKGVVTAKKAGSATVTVTVGGKKVGTCKVTVVKAPTSISFAEKSVTLGVKETLALKPTITKGSHSSYTWSVKNKKIATVDKNGVVTGKKAGKTTVTVKTHNGLKTMVTVTVQKAPTKVSLPKKAVTLGVKEALTLTPKIAKGAHTSFTWTVADKKIATVTKDGRITGKKAGETTVTVQTHNGKKATVKVTVMKAPTAVSLEAKTMALGVKESVKLKPSIASDAHTSYTWTVKDKKIATVTKDGKLTGVKAGKTTVTVRTHNGKKATMTVQVMNAPGSITLSGKSRKLTVGDAIMLMPTLPKKTASRITWSSSKKSVASVDASGVVRALKKGTAKITAKTFNGKKAVCTVTVGEGASYLAFEAEALSVGVKEKVTLKPRVNEGAKVKYTWTTGDKKVATVSSKGVVTGVKAGSTDVTVKTQNGLTATVKVTVLAAPKKVTLDKTKAELPVNQTLQLKATLTKKTASRIKWSADNKKVATVDENGLVTAVAAGKANITAQTFNGKKATCVVTVREASNNDQFKMFYDAYEESEKKALDTSAMTIEPISVDGLDDSEDLMEFIEKYNGIVSEINEDNDSFIKSMDQFVKAMEELDGLMGKTTIVARQDGVEIECGLLSLSTNTAKQQQLRDNGMSKSKAFANSLVVISKANKNSEDVDTLASKVQKWLGDMKSFISDTGKALNIADSISLNEVKRTNEAVKQAKQELDNAKKAKKGKATIAMLKRAYKNATKSYNNWLNWRTAINACIKEFERFKLTQIGCAASVGYDVAILAQINPAVRHGHPFGRELDDTIRDKYAQELLRDIESAHKAIYKDIGFNVGTIVIELTLFGKGGLAKGAEKVIAKYLNKSIAKRLSEISGERWIKTAWMTGTTAVGMSIDEEIEQLVGQVQREENILHGNIRGTISGKVIDADTKKPIAGALVETDEKRSTTKADGSFVFSAMYGDYSGDYAVKCTKEGYVDGAGEVIVDENASDAAVTIELSTEGLPIDEAHFPDANFRMKVREFDLDGSDTLSDEEIARITTVSVDNCAISSLEGIQYFTAMRNLSCAGNSLTQLDVMQCPALQTLDCRENEMSGLNVAGHPALQTLYCGGDASLSQISALRSLDASWCPVLKEVYCNGALDSRGSLMTLSVSGSTVLQMLDCVYNQLTTLDVSGCKSLQKLFCNSNKLTGLNCGGLSMLTDLNCGDNQLTTLDVSGCTALQVLNCAVNQLTGLNVSTCTQLRSLYCSNNKINELNLLQNKYLDDLQYDNNLIELLLWKDRVVFGHYEQDNNLLNGKEPIEWRVLKENGNTLTLISEYGLDAKPYHTEGVAITWQNCSLRAWLNGSFLNSAFTSAGQAKLQTVTVKAEDNPHYGIEAGNDTQDKVYLLSISEANSLLAGNSDRQCKPTAYARAQGAFTSTNSGNCWWWLRSPGDDSSNAADVADGGGVLIGGSYVTYDFEVVRPVVCLRLS